MCGGKHAGGVATEGGENGGLSFQTGLLAQKMIGRHKRDGQDRQGERHN
jgi:hypothetical protein